MAGLVYIDAETWRYENPGTASLLKISGNDLTSLPVTKSRTRTAFWQNQRVATFPIPASKELWIKFDLYYSGTSRWRAYDRLNGNDTGVGRLNTATSLRAYINGPIFYEFQNALTAGTLHTILLHMVSDATNGLLEVWVNGTKYVSNEFAAEDAVYKGDVEGGADFENFYLQSENNSNLFSNVIISNKRIGLGENVIGYDLPQSLLFDTERQLTSYGIVAKPLFDVARKLATGINREAYLTFPSGATILDAPTPDGAAVFTIEVAVAATATPSSGGRFIIIGWLMPGRYLNQFEINLSSEGNPEAAGILERTATFKYLESGVIINDGKIHRIAVVSYEDQSAEMYVDGISVAHEDGREFELPSGDFKVGNPNINFYELRIWSTARTAEEIFSDIRGDEEGLVAWYLPEEGGLRDHSVNQRTTRNEGGTPIYSVTFPPQKFDLEWIFKAPFPVSATFDIQREVVSYWRYYNLGTELYLLTQGTQLNNLPADKSKTGIAFYQTAQEKCFDIPASNDLWIKFDVYTTDLATRWRAFCDSGSTLFGVRSYDDGALGVFVYKTKTQLLVYDVVKAGELQTFLLHITIASTEVWVDGGGSNSYSNSKGSARLWIDGEHRYSRDTDTTIYAATLGDFYLQSDGEGTFFSNIIISDRQIGFDEGAQRFTCETERIVCASGDLSADLVREVLAPVNIQKAVDLQRTVIRPAEVSADIIALLVNTLGFDTERVPLMYELFHCDIKRQLPHKLTITPIDVPEQIDTTGVQSISIDLAAQQLTDQLSFTWIHPAEIMQQIRGQYLDYKFDMRIEEITQEGILRHCNCCSDIDELLYTQFTYKIRQKDYQSGLYVFAVGELTSEFLAQLSVDLSKGTVCLDKPYASASTHMKKIAAAMGLELVMDFDDFVSTLDTGTNEVTYNDLMRELFGWTSRLPHLLINCYIRNGTLYVIQRGHEANVIDLTGLKHTIPSVNAKLIRTTWGNTPWSKNAERIKTPARTDWDTEQVLGNEIPDETDTPDDPDEPDEPEEPKEPARLLKTFDSFTNGEVTTQIEYAYDDDGMLIKQITTTTGGDIPTMEIVENVYGEEGGLKYLSDEYKTTLEWSGAGWVRTEKTVAHHSVLLQGQKSVTSVDEDGEVISQTTPAQYNEKTTPFEEKQYKNERYTKEVDGFVFEGNGYGAYTYVDGKKYEVLGYITRPQNIPAEMESVTLNGVYLYDSTFPVGGAQKMKELTAEIKWLNRKTQETISMDVYDFPHVIDFNDRIIFNGNEYFLESNTAVKTPRIINKQSLRFVRWY